MVRFPLTGLLDEHACYDALLAILHPDGLSCPRGHPLPPTQQPHDRHRAPIMDYRCRQCGAVYNVFTGTIFSKVRYPCSTIIQILRGIAQGTPTKHLAEELHIDRGHLLDRRHQIQALVDAHFSPLSPAGGLGHRSG